MPRKTTKTRGSGKTIIRVFCEGESEQAYTEFLKKQFSDVAVIKYPKETGLFDEAMDRFTKDPLYRDYAEVIDEVWFFFDVETKDSCLWDKRIKIIKKIRKLRKEPNIKVRLMMTTGCIEYWLMLHYKMYTPSIQTVAEKEHVMSELIKLEPTYKKGDFISTEKIAAHFQTAINNSKATVKNLLSDGLPCLEDTDERNQWLCKNCYTFSNVYEALEYLQG
ncbi:MAG: RloB domain-containing protein [Clostridia bacterium]|nr:RloB domain-containing protein [Clostridia bacterium]